MTANTSRPDHPTGGSVYQRVLGDDFSLLGPRLQAYFGPIPEGWVGVGRGVYRVAGSGIRLLRPVLAVMAARHVLFPEFEPDVPFTVANHPEPEGALGARRTFEFRRRTRVMEDTMTVVGGRLVDRLGKRRGLEVALDLSVVAGGLRMRSTGLALHVGRLRVPLPQFAVMRLDERTDPDDDSRQSVDVRVDAPVLGEIFRYTGDFVYELRKR